MESVFIFRAIGVVLILAGITFVSNPELISNKPIPSDTFDAIERRVWWGLFIGFGVLLLFHHELQPWKTTIAATCSSLLFGLLIARIIGILLEGSVTKQWLYVGLEIVMLIPLVWWYFSTRT